MRRPLSDATLIRCVLACWLLLGLAGAARAQQPAPRSVVLKPAPPQEEVLAFSSVLRETRAPHAQLNTLLPEEPRTPRDRWLAFDKAKHLGGGFLVVLSSQYVFEGKAALPRDPALALSLTTGVAASLGKEVYDRWIGRTRYFSTKDLVADALGLHLAAGVVVL